MLESDVSSPWYIGSWSSNESTSVSFDETIDLENVSSSNSSVISERREDHRTVIREEIGPIPEVTVEFMLEHIVPNSNVDIDATMTKLEQENLWSAEFGWKTNQGRNLEGPASTDSSQDSNDIEMENFEKIKDTYNSIISYAQFHDRSSKEPTLRFQQFSNTTVSDHASKGGPDRCGALTTTQDLHTTHLNVPEVYDQEVDESMSSDPTPSALKDTSITKWFDSACVWEYKSKSRRVELNENVLNVVWRLHRTMQIDHRRRFLFGISVENEDTRIWFACRQILFVTRPFNFNTNASQLVQLVASLAYATPTRLGYDPTMKLCWRENTFRYDIEWTTTGTDGSERTVIYQTRRLLSNTAYDLRGRGTRVYLASALDQNDPSPTNPLVVLKDCWIDANCPREGDTHRKVLEGASEEEKKMFLTIYQHGVVQIDNQDDSTEELILRGKKIKVVDPECDDDDDGVLECEVGIFNLYTAGHSVSRRSSEHRAKALRNFPTYLETLDVRQPNVYPPKVHYRIVYEEIGESLTKIANFGKLTLKILDRVMFDITRALHYMAKRGYVHRDVSAGNILWFGDHAKLSDLEFTREYGTGGTSDSRTGTHNFMAGEVMAGRHSVYNGWDANRMYVDIPFVYNPVHDLESLWWVGVWCTMWFYPAPCDKILHPPQQNGSNNDGLQATLQIDYQYKDFTRGERRRIKKVQYHAQELFSAFYSNFPFLRMDEIHHKTRFASRLARKSRGFSAIEVFLETFRQCISSGYIEAQSALPRTEVAYFTENLRIKTPDPLLKYDPTLEGSKVLIHDLVLEALSLVKTDADFDDAILWPLNSIDLYSTWLSSDRRQDFLETWVPEQSKASESDTDSDSN